MTNRKSDLWDRASCYVGYPEIARALGVSRITLIRRLRARGIVLSRWRGRTGRNSPVFVRRGYFEEFKKGVLGLK